MPEILLEVCIDSIASGIAAEVGGARRIELCSALSEGGLTPTVGFLRQVKRKLKIPIFVMIRPRRGDFIYSQDEIEIMKEDIRVLKESGADGFVFGLLTRSAEIDIAGCEQLLEECKQLPSTFHRAFDQISSPSTALETIIRLGFTRVLTSGQESSAEKGIGLLKELVDQAGDRINIMAGAGVSAGNAAEIINSTGVKEIHASARVLVKSEMEPPKSRVTMGSADDDSYVYVCDSSVVSQIVDNIKTQAY